MRLTLIAALLLVVVAITFINPTQTLFTEMKPGACCPEYNIKKPIPARLLASYKVTSSKCALPAVIFVTKRNKWFCADSRARWTQDRIQHLESKRHQPPSAAVVH